MIKKIRDADGFWREAEIKDKPKYNKQIPIGKSMDKKEESTEERAMRIMETDYSIYNDRSKLEELPEEKKKIIIKEILDKIENKDKWKEEIDKANPELESADVFGRLGQAKEFYNRNPYTYDKAGLFWIWNHEDKCYKQSDETDILNSVRKAMNVDTIESKSKAEIITALKQIGRENTPLEVPASWIQFKDKVVDIKKNIIFPAKPSCFFTSPIPWELGASEDTPTIDKLFRDWVVKDGVQDESYIDTLREVVAYALEDSGFMQILIWLCGSGSNGKGCFLNFLIRLLGKSNVCSSELKTLINRNFESSALYKKKAIVMGEVDAYDLTNTNLLKQLSGEDLIRYEFKGKTPFSDKSTATCFIATNSLPVTPDNSTGFHRRNLIIDFPNVFTVGKDVLSEIPEVEYSNFCLKAIRILQALHITGLFTNSGTVEERKQRYEDRSNPIVHFIREKCSESPTESQVFSLFLKKFQDYLKENRLRPMSAIQTSKALKMEGYDIKSKHVVLDLGTAYESDTHITCIFGLKLLGLTKN